MHEGIAEPTDAEASAAIDDKDVLYSPSFLAEPFRRGLLEKHQRQQADGPPPPGTKGTSCLRMLVSRSPSAQLGFHGFVVWDEAWDKRRGEHSVELKFLSYERGCEAKGCELLDAMLQKLHTTRGGEVTTKVSERLPKPLSEYAPATRRLGFLPTCASGVLSNAPPLTPCVPLAVSGRSSASPASLATRRFVASTQLRDTIEHMHIITLAITIEHALVMPRVDASWP